MLDPKYQNLLTPQESEFIDNLKINTDWKVYYNTIEGSYKILRN